MKCQKCNHENLETSKFCNSCGAELKAITIAKSEIAVTTMAISNEKPLGKLNKLYIIFTGVGAVLGLIGGPIVSLIIAAVGLFMAWMVIHSIASVKLMKLNKTNYKLPKPINEKALIDFIKSNLNNDDIKVDQNSNGLVATYKNTAVMIVKFNKDNFYIRSKMTFVKKLKNAGKVNTVVLYNNASQAVPYLAKYIQQMANQF